MSLTRERLINSSATDHAHALHPGPRPRNFEQDWRGRRRDPAERRHKQTLRPLDHVDSYLPIEKMFSDDTADSRNDNAEDRDRDYEEVVAYMQNQDVDRSVPSVSRPWCGRAARTLESTPPLVYSRRRPLASGRDAAAAPRGLCYHDRAISPSAYLGAAFRLRGAFVREPVLREGNRSRASSTRAATPGARFALYANACTCARPGSSPPCCWNPSPEAPSAAQRPVFRVARQHGEPRDMTKSQ
ncbi:hypothetical protein Q5P01_000102 [Channa striata]|uniref:Uncharacterized protein n=1 Tax=Channa striata TaxID=64152 RepID=A0AA88LII4_CHASR|nr:hypothetical protein Q5P01_000102 [Channa striata]